MLSFVCLILATISTILFIVMTIKGKQYEQLLESVDDKEFPLKELYGVGMAWEYAIPMLGYEGKLARKIRVNVSLFYGERYTEYYCRIILAQVYTYVHISICFFSLLSGFIDDSSCIIVLLIGVMLGAAIGDYYLKQVTGKIEKRAEECVIEIPNMVMKLTLMINSGMILRDAWYAVTNTVEGQLQGLMKQACELMDNGSSEAEAIYKFGVLSGSKEIKKFSSSLIQGIEKGNAELVGMLMQQSDELWENKRQHLLQKGETAATKLIIPTTMMFVGIVLVVITSALSGMGI